MDWKDRLSYCSVCINGEKKFEKGHVCSIGMNMNFKEVCPEFNLDRKKRDEKTRKIKEKIEYNKKKKGFWESMDDDDSIKLFYLVSGEQIKKRKTSSFYGLKLKEIRIRKTGHFILFNLIFIAWLKYGFEVFFEPGYDFSEKLLGTLIFLLIIPVSIYYNFNFFTNKVKFSMDKNGIKMNDAKFNWNRILYVYRKDQIYRKNQGKETYFIFHLNLGEEYVLDASELPITPERLGFLIYSYLKEFKKN